MGGEAAGQRRGAEQRRGERWGGTYQRPAAEEDHEDDEGLEPVMLNDAEAGFPDVPPDLPSLAGDVHVEAGKPLHASWRWGQRAWVASPPERSFLCFY